MVPFSSTCLALLFRTTCPDHSFLTLAFLVFLHSGVPKAERRLAAKVEDYKHELDSWLAAVEVTDSGQCDSTGQVEPSLMDLWPTTLSRARFCDPQNFLDSPILRAVTESNIAQPPRFDTAQCKRILAKWSQFGAHFPSQWLQESNALAEVGM